MKLIAKLLIALLLFVVFESKSFGIFLLKKSAIENYLPKSPEKDELEIKNSKQRHNNAGAAREPNLNYIEVTIQ